MVKIMNRSLSNKIVYGWYADNEIFYVGIGTRRRSSSMMYRNNHCLNKRAKAEKENSFEVRILESGLTFDQACSIECQLIEQYGRLDLGTGILTNMTSGGEGRRNYTPTNETRDKMSKAKLGKRKSKETRKKMSKAKQGENHPMYGIRGKEHPAYGRKNTKETKRKMRESSARKGQTGSAHPRSKPVQTPLGLFDSCKQAAEAHKLNIQTLNYRVNSDSANMSGYFYT